MQNNTFASVMQILTKTCQVSWLKMAIIKIAMDETHKTIYYPQRNNSKDYNIIHDVYIRLHIKPYICIYVYFEIDMILHKIISKY